MAGFVTRPPLVPIFLGERRSQDPKSTWIIGVVLPNVVLHEEHLLTDRGEPRRARGTTRPTRDQRDSVQLNLWNGAGQSSRTPWRVAGKLTYFCVSCCRTNKRKVRRSQHQRSSRRNFTTADAVPVAAAVGAHDTTPKCRNRRA